MRNHRPKLGSKMAAHRSACILGALPKGKGDSVREEISFDCAAIDGKKKYQTESDTLFFISHISNCMVSSRMFTTLFRFMHLIQCCNNRYNNLHLEGGGKRY